MHVTQLYLYAQNNGRNTRITLDDTPSTSLRYGVGCSEIGQVAFFIFNISSIVLPFVLYMLVWIVILSCRPRVRGLLAPSTSKNSTSQNYAAVILTGMVFSTYVVICDGFAVYNTFFDDVLNRYEEEGIHMLTIGSIITITVLDISAFVVSFGVIFHWSCVASCTCCHKRCYCEKCFVCGIRCFFVACLCRYIVVHVAAEDNGNGGQNQKVKYRRLEDFAGERGPSVNDDRNGERGPSVNDDRNGERGPSVNDDRNGERGPSVNDDRNGERGPSVNDDRNGERGPSVNDDLNHETIHRENKAWLLTVSLLAPLVCFGTHFTFMMLAWSSDPDSSSSMTIVLTLSFLYYFFGFRQIYIAVASCLHSRSRSKNRRHCCVLEIEEASKELNDQRKSLKQFNFPAFLVTFFSGFLLVGIEVLLIMTYTNLPAPVTTIPSNILNILNLALIVGSGLVAYKLLTIHTPNEDVILENLVNTYDQNDQNNQNDRNVQTSSHSQESAERVGTILGNALKKYYPPPPATQAPPDLERPARPD